MPEMTSDMIHEGVGCPLCGGSRHCHWRILNGFQTDRCLDCGLLFVHPRPVEDALNKHYRDLDGDALTGFYQRMATPNVLAGYDRKLEWIEGLLPGRGRLLEFGCGAAYLMERAVHRGWQADGVDLGAWTERAARARGVSNVHVGRLADLSFPDGYFDVVYAAQVLEHLHAPLNELTELRRILRPGGVLYVDVPNNRTLPIMLGVDDFELNMPPGHLNYFTPRTIRLLLQRGGFDLETVGSEGGLKWENLIGRRIRSEIADAARAANLNAAHDNDSHPSRAPSKQRASLKRWIMPLVKRPLYAWAKLGISLYAVARRPGEPTT